MVYLSIQNKASGFGRIHCEAHEKRLANGSEVFAFFILTPIMFRDVFKGLLIFDRFVLSTFGYFVDQCPDKMYLSRLLEKLIPLQNGLSSNGTLMRTNYLKGKGLTHHE